MRRGGLANTVLNFNSHFTIVSDTATDFAKSCDDFNICFQALFLSALNKLQGDLWYKGTGVNCYAATITCHECIFLLRDDKYTLDRTTYPGVEIGEKIDTLTAKNVGLSNRSPFQTNMWPLS